MTPAHRPIEISSATPWPLRLVLGGIGAFLCFIVTSELGRALWPVSVLAVLVGVIVWGGVAIGLTLLVVAVFAPDQQWRFEPGRITIISRIWGRQHAQVLRPSDVRTLSVMTIPADDGPEGHVLASELTREAARTLWRPAFARPLLLILILTQPVRFFRDREACMANILTPRFGARADAEAALARFRSRR